MIIKPNKISVIISTYNSPDWLEKVIIGFQCQKILPQELIIADDGSSDQTKNKINELKANSAIPIIHVWHEDNGFQKTKILNKAISASSGDYLIFTDGDCVPKANFIATHISYAEPGYFLSGGYFKLPMQTSLAITRNEIENGNAFNTDWLRANGLTKTHKALKLTASPFQQKIFNFLTPTKATWNGHNASGWRTDIIAANGFDERMQYGGEDRELGERLFNAGLKSKQIRYSAIVIHLDHKRGYVNQEMIIKNKAIRAETKKQKLTKTAFGIK
jgi:glycosyltransferase involved in cell wall biosynthesis